ncbi:MAG: Cardiolipin synthetase, partial [Deltaproteobacteria bacterium]
MSFIWSEGKVSSRIVTALAGRTRDGVPCRVIVDALGSPNFANVQKQLEGIG